MKGGTRAAVAIGVGYLLGRRRKLRLAAVLAAGAATGGIAGLGGAALKRGTQALGSSEALGNLSPQLGGIADAVRGDLVEAGKAAAMAAVTGRIESLTDSLHDRAESLRDPAAGAGKAVRGQAGLGRHEDEPEDDGADYDEAGYEDEDYEDDDQEPEGEEREGEEREDDEREDDEDQADEDEGRAAQRRPAPSRRSGGSRSPRDSRDRAPVTRARR